MERSLPVLDGPRRPEWMKVHSAPSAIARYFEVRSLLHGQRLHTICEEARCPNIAECWSRGTATFQILGDTCTRACRYCYVHLAGPNSPRIPWSLCGLRTPPARWAQHVVVRIGRPGRPARQGRRPLRRDDPGTEEQAAERVGGGADARLPRLRGGGAGSGDARRACSRVFNHNIETVPTPPYARCERRLTTRRCGCSAGRRNGRLPPCSRSRASSSASGANDEVVETMRDLRAAGVDVVTIGQYLQPSQKHTAIDRWVHPGRVSLVPRAGRGAGPRSCSRAPSSLRATAPTGKRSRHRPRRRRLLKRAPPPGDAR